MLMFPFYFLFAIIIQLDGATVKNISHEFYSKQNNVTILGAFSLEIDQFKLKELIRLDFELPSTANNMLIVMNTSEQSVSKRKLSCGPLRLGVLKRNYNKENVFFLDDSYIDYRRFDGDRNSPSNWKKSISINSTSKFLLMYSHGGLCSTDIITVLSITGLLTYPLLPNSFCQIDQEKINFKKIELCISKYSEDDRQYLKDLFDFSFVPVSFARKYSVIILIMVLSTGLLIFIIIYTIVICFMKFCPKANSQMSRDKNDAEAKVPLIKKDEVTDCQDYFDLKYKLNQKHDFEGSSFSENTSKAIKLRSDNLKNIKEFIKKKMTSSGEMWRDEALKLCPKPNSSISIAFLGPAKSGKTALISALLEIESEFELLSSEEHYAHKITRIVYSDPCGFKKIGTGKWRSDETYHCEEFHESITSQDEDLGNITDRLKIDNFDEGKVENLSEIIEIGYPSPFLKSGLNIIDFPGLNIDQKISSICLQILRELKPDIICYVYDYSYGFNESDANNLNWINDSFYFDHRHRIQYLLVANKWDLYVDLDGLDIFDSKHGEHHNPTGNIEIRSTCQFPRTKKKKYSRFDKDRLLPALQLTTLSAYRHKDEGLQLFKSFRAEILLKIINSSRSILVNVAEVIAKCDMEDHQKKVDLWFQMKSLSVDCALINTIYSDKTLISDFSGGFKLFGCSYLDGPIQFVEILNEEIFPEMSRIFNERRDNGRGSVSFRSSLIFLDYERKGIYLIDKEMPRERLLDRLDLIQFNNDNDRKIRVIESILTQIWEENYELERILPNFRPDNVFFDPDFDDFQLIAVNHNIPNRKDLPFQLDKSVDYLNPRIQDSYPYDNEALIGHYFFSVGYFLWLLLSNGDYNKDRWEQVLKDQQYDCPFYIITLLTYCYNSTKGNTKTTLPSVKKILRRIQNRRLEIAN